MVGTQMVRYSSGQVLKWQVLKWAVLKWAGTQMSSVRPNFDVRYGTAVLYGTVRTVKVAVRCTILYYYWQGFDINSRCCYSLELNISYARSDFDFENTTSYSVNKFWGPWHRIFVTWIFHFLRKCTVRRTANVRYGTGTAKFQKYGTVRYGKNRVRSYTMARHWSTT